MFKICTVGCSNTAISCHGPSYEKYKKDYPDTELSACCDLDEEKAKSFKEKFGFERHYTDYIKMLEEEKPDVVCIDSDIENPIETAVQIMSRGHSIVFESPEYFTSDNLSGISSAAINGNVSVRVALNRRFLPQVTALKRRIKKDSLCISEISYQMKVAETCGKDMAYWAFVAIDFVKYIAGSEYTDISFCYGNEKISACGSFKNGTVFSIDVLQSDGLVGETVSVSAGDSTFTIECPVCDGEEKFEECGYYELNRSFFEFIRRESKRLSDLAGCKQSVEIHECIKNGDVKFERKSYLRDIESPFNPPRITPPSVHPRLMLKSQDLDRIRANMADPDCQKEYGLWKSLCDEGFDKYAEDFETGAYNSHICIMLEAKALDALLSGNGEKAKDVVDTALKLCINYDPESDWLMKARFGGHIVHTCSLVYDWLYPYFNEKQKWELIENCERILSTTLEMGYPPSKQSPISSHGTEAQLLRDCLSFSIAVYDEKPDVYNYCAGRLFDEYVPTYKTFFEGRFQLQGPAYGGYRFCFSAWCQLLFEAMCGERIFDENHDNLCESFFYLIRPDGEYIRLGDDFNESKGYGSYTQKNPAAVPMFFAHALTGRKEYIDYYFAHNDEQFLVPLKHGRDFYQDGSYSEGLLSPTAFLIFYGNTAENKSESRPAAKYFGTPAGVTLYKSGDTIVLMKIGEYQTTGHDHYDCGQFQIYHKGSLATDSGYYDWFGCEHHYNYAVRTYAHNCITVTDPDKIGTDYFGAFWQRPGVIYDGGQVFEGKGYDVPNLDVLLESYGRGKVLSHAETEDVIELVGDLKVPYRDSVESYVRSMRFEPKTKVFTVKDDIVAQSENYIKAFHLHCQTEPSIDSDRQFTVYNDNAKLVCTVIEPANVKIEAIGGKDNEFSLYGVNHPRNSKSLHGGENVNADHHDEAGWGRITLTALDKKKADCFLVRMEIVEI